jgi:hypothetical protein
MACFLGNLPIGAGFRVGRYRGVVLGSNDCECRIRAIADDGGQVNTGWSPQTVVEPGVVDMTEKQPEAAPPQQVGDFRCTCGKSCLSKIGIGLHVKRYGAGHAYVEGAPAVSSEEIATEEDVVDLTCH